MTVVDPGYFRTDFLDQRSLSRSERVIDDYAATVGALRELAQALLHTLIRAAVGGEHTFPLGCVRPDMSLRSVTQRM